LSLVDRVASILDDLEIPYVPGGSLASTLVGEPRATNDADIAVRVPPGREEARLPRTSAEFYVQTSDARDALRTGDSFNLVDHEHTLKVDLFVLGDGLLDCMQIERSNRRSRHLRHSVGNVTRGSGSSQARLVPSE
jgi:hypothetical protein